MTEERPGYDAGGTIEIETETLIRFLEHACDGLKRMQQPGSQTQVYRIQDLRRRIMAGQVYVGVCDWPVEEVSGG